MITINKEEIRECYNFAVTAWENKSQSPRQFGTPELREKNSFIADQISGKLAEYIFKYTLLELNDRIEVNLNFSHYSNPRQIDNGDVEIILDNKRLPIKIDVKGSSYKAQWLLVEMYKYNDPESGLKVSDRYIMVKFSEEVPDSTKLRNNPESILDLSHVSGDVIGWANHSDFLSNNDNSAWFLYRTGQKPFRIRVLPRSSNSINDKNHLFNYINKVISINQYTEEDFLLNLPLEAKLNVGLPVPWLNTNLDKVLKL